eukprot:TRINITY_DN31352_c0_g1_i2.p1 TRINITY_DN31352_c0_g1~~TRINITY_DN31352_c0_g1_i2.p1  ORF type:complete len:195 (+),score=44.69 TRINITY_DN31352_c0_g1_i2:206-790(+)
MVCQLLVGPTRQLGLLDAADASGWSPLHLAAESGHASSCRVLARSGASMKLGNVMHGGITALHLATKEGHIKTLEELLECDADANVTDALGFTALHLAAQRAEPAAVAMLLRHRADVTLPGGPSNKTAMDLLPLDHLSREKVAKLLSAYNRGATSMRTDSRFELPEVKPRERIVQKFTKPSAAEVAAEDDDLWL